MIVWLSAVIGKPKDAAPLSLSMRNMDDGPLSFIQLLKKFAQMSDDEFVMARNGDVFYNYFNINRFCERPYYRDDLVCALRLAGFPFPSNFWAGLMDGFTKRAKCHLFFADHIRQC
jgi:hypothetical protein